MTSQPSLSESLLDSNFWLICSWFINLSRFIELLDGYLPVKLNLLHLIFRFLVSAPSHRWVCVPERCSDAKVRFSFTRYYNEFTPLTSYDYPLFILLFYWAQKLFGPFLFALNIYYTDLHIWTRFHGLLFNNNFHFILGSFFLHPYIFLPAPPQYHANTILSLLFFKNPKMHLNCTYLFLHSGLWNPENFRIDTSGKFSDPPIRNSKYTFHIQKFIIQKKHSGFTDP